MNTSAENPIVKLQRTFAAPRERVWAAWTDPALIKQWFGPEGCTALSVESDLCTGGKYRFVVKSPHGEHAVGGEFREVTAPSRLVHTWQWEDDPAYAEHETLVTVDFIDRGESTEVHLTHEHLPTAENRANHEHGWNGSFEKLTALLAS